MPSEIETGKITKTTIGGHDGYCGILVASIWFDFDGSGQAMMSGRLDGAVKHRSLGSNDPEVKGDGWGGWLNWLSKLLEILEVDAWEKLPGTIARIRRDEKGYIVAIGHPYKNRWADERDYKP